MRVLPFFTEGHQCPRCGHHTDRVRTRFYLRPVRWLFPQVRRRVCMNGGCAWRGFASPARVEAADALHAGAR
ncbi:MAG TPA: hypothetical protein VF771_01175 [Longimicrobiaceae bacterium]